MATPPPAAAHPAAVGYTLVEVAITLAVMAVLGVIAAPAFNSQIARQRLQAAARNLQADISLARVESNRRGQPLGFRFQTGRDWCYTLSVGPLASAGGVDCRGLPAPGNTTTARTPLPPGVLKLVRAADNPGVLLLEASPLLVEPSSGSSATQWMAQTSQASGQARFVGQANPDQVLQVRVGPHGRASVCAADAPVGGTPRCAPPAAPS